VEVKYQKYIHNQREKSSCISSLIKFKNKYCSYMRNICNKGIIKSLIGYSSYQIKKKVFMISMKYRYHVTLFYIMNKNILITY